MGIRVLWGIGVYDQWPISGPPATGHNRSMQSQVDELTQALSALSAESDQRRRAECMSHIQSDSVQRALDLLVREPDVTGFFRGFIHNLVEESESQKCTVWLLSEDKSSCDFWMANVKGQFFDRDAISGEQFTRVRETMAAHLLADTAGWTSTMEYSGVDPRLPEPVREHHASIGVESFVIVPLVLPTGTLGWMTGTLGFPAPLAALGIVTELLAPLALIAGAGGRLAAGMLFFHMAFAASIHVENGFFMNWFGSLKTGQEGFEYHLLAMALAAVVVIAGSGKLSLDRVLARRARVTSGAS